MCVYVIYSPTPLAPITPTHNPSVTLSVTLSVTHRVVSTHRCTYTHKVPTLSIFAPRRPGKPGVCVCVRVWWWWSYVLSVALLADCISGRAPVPRPSCPAVHLGLWSSGKPRGAVGRLRPHTTSSSAPRGIECWSHSGSDVTSQRKQDVWQMWQPLFRLIDDGWADEYAHLSTWDENVHSIQVHVTIMVF